MSRIPTDAEIERCGRAAGDAVCSGWSGGSEMKARIKRFIADGCRTVPVGCLPEYYAAVAAEWSAICASTPPAPQSAKPRCPKCGSERVQRSAVHCRTHALVFCWVCSEFQRNDALWEIADPVAWRSNGKAGETCDTCKRPTLADEAAAPCANSPSTPAKPAPATTPAPIATACERARLFLHGDWRAYLNDARACRILDELRHQLRTPSASVARKALGFIVGPECSGAPESERKAVVGELMAATKPGGGR